MGYHNKNFLPLWLLFVIYVSSAAAQMVETRTLGDSGRAEIYPSGVVISADGNWIVADTGNDRVVKYRPNGSVVWSVGKHGSGVGEFSQPRDIDVAANGNIYVTDSLNTRIVMLNPDGVWIKDWRGPVPSIVDKSLMGISVKAGKVYFTITGKQQVRVWNTAMTTQHLVIEPHGVCQYSGLRDVDIDANGNIYATSYPPQHILKFTASGQCIERLNIPSYGIRVAFDPVLGEELLYIGRSGYTPEIKVYNLNGTYIGGMAKPGEWYEPGTFDSIRFFTVVSDGDVVAADMRGFSIERFNRIASGWNHAQVLPDPIIPPPLTNNAVFNQVRDVAFGANGIVHAMDYMNQRVVMMSPSGSVIKSCGNRKSMGWPNAVAIDTVNGDIWYPHAIDRKLMVMQPDCSIKHEITADSIGLSGFAPKGIAIRASDRRAYILDTPNNRIVILDMNTRQSIGTFGSAGVGINQFRAPYDIAVDPASSNIWVADTYNHRIVELEVSGSSITWERSIANNFLRPEGVAVDSVGRIFVADTQNARVVAMDSAGSVVDIVNDLYFPTGVAVNAANEIHVSDTHNDKIRVYSMDALGSLQICGRPFYDRSTEKGLYLWERKPCGGAIRYFNIRALAGGASGALTYNGVVNADKAFSDVVRIHLESRDVLMTTNNDLSIEYNMRLISPYTDGFEFKVPGSANVCFGANLPAGTQLRVGPNATPVTVPFNLKTLSSC